MLSLAMALLLTGCGAAEPGAPGTEELRETAEVLSRERDFDHDGTPETTEAVTIPGQEGEGAAWYELRVTSADGGLLWSQTAAEAHAGWTSLFALELDGEDYLLRYNPYMNTGLASYAYQIFSLGEKGEELVLRENQVDFDIHFGSPAHAGFDSTAVAAFLEEVHGYLDASTLLLSTQGGACRTGGSGEDYWEDLDFLPEELRDGSMTLEESLRRYAETMAQRAEEASPENG